MSVVDPISGPRPRSPFEGLVRPGRYGAGAEASVIVEDVSLRRLRGVTGKVGAPGVRRGADADLIVTAPDQGLLVAHVGRANASPPADVVVTELTGSRAILRLGGPRAIEVLARFVPLDLHPSVFGPDDARATVAGHVPVTLWRTPNGTAIELATYRSYAGDLWHMVTAAATPFGYEVA